MYTESGKYTMSSNINIKVIENKCVIIQNTVNLQEEFWVLFFLILHTFWDFFNTSQISYLIMHGLIAVERVIKDPTKKDPK